MACGDPSTSCMKHMKMTICTLCGRDMNSCNNQEHEVNYQKQVDPPTTQYTQILPDSRYDEDERQKLKKTSTQKAPPLQVCIQIPVVTDKTTSQPSEKAAPSPTAPEKSESHMNKTQTKTPTPGSSVALKASCLPAGGCPPPVKMMLCLPCPPPDHVATASEPSGSASCPRGKPTDYTYRCESRELRGGNLYQCCQCIKRNGLQHDCPRTPCQGRPACLTKPWPDCWPSGGCHGIDYSREKGVKRIDPCREQRFDKKECRPPGGSGSGSGAKADCGGNMMVVVCPPPSNQ